MRKWKQLVSVILLTTLLIVLGLVNGAEPFADCNSQISEAQISSAAAGPFPEIRLKRPRYDDDGNLVGCSGKGNKCVIVVLTVAGERHEILMTAQDVILR